MREDVETNIKTPNGGHPLWVVLITCKDDVIGNINFKDAQSHCEFKRMYAALDEKKWGLVELTFDVE